MATPEIRRCAWGLILMDNVGTDDDPAYDLKGTLCSPLPGNNQTVNRGEMWPAIHLASHSYGDGAYHSDSDYLVRGFRKGKHINPRGKNADLWALVDRATRERVGHFQIIKVKAHRDVGDLDVDNVVDLQNSVGNAYVDAIAD